MYLTIEEFKQSIKLTQVAAKALKETEDTNTAKIAYKFLKTNLEGLSLISGAFSQTYNLAYSLIDNNSKKCLSLVEHVTQEHLTNLKYAPNLESLVFEEKDNDFELLSNSQTLDNKLIAYNDILVDAVDTIDDLFLVEQLSKSQEKVTQELYSEIISSLALQLSTEDLKSTMLAGYELIKTSLYKASILLKKMLYSMLEFIKFYQLKYKNLLKDITEVQSNYSFYKRYNKNIDLKDKTINLNLLYVFNDDIDKYIGKTDETGMIGFYDNTELLDQLLKTYHSNIKTLKGNIEKVLQVEKLIFKNKAQILSYIEGSGNVDGVVKLVNNINSYISTVMIELYSDGVLYHDINTGIRFEDNKISKKKISNYPRQIKISINEDTVTDKKFLVSSIMEYLSASDACDSIVNNIYNSVSSKEVYVLTELVKGVEKLSKNEEMEKEELQKEFTNIKKLYKMLGNYKTLKTIVTSDINSYISYHIDNMFKLISVLHKER